MVTVTQLCKHKTYTLGVAHFFISLFNYFLCEFLCVYVWLNAWMQCLWRSESLLFLYHSIPKDWIPVVRLGSKPFISWDILMVQGGLRYMNVYLYLQKSKTKQLVSCNLRIWKMEQKNQEFKPSLSYMRPCITKYPST